MGHESGQFVIPERLMYVSIPDKTMRVARDIGEAKIVNTLFGKAKVRVIREQDKKRNLWLLGFLVAVLLAVIGWDSWVAMQQAELSQGDESLATSKGKIMVSEPAYQPAFKDPSSKSQSLYRRSKTLIQSEIDSLVTRKREAPPPSITEASRQEAAKHDTAKAPVIDKPGTPKIATTAKPQATTPATISKTTVAPTGTAQTTKATVQAQPAISAASAPAIAPPAARTVVSPATTKPAVSQQPAVTPVTAPAIKEPAITPPSSDSPVPAEVKTQP